MPVTCTDDLIPVAVARLVLADGSGRTVRRAAGVSARRLALAVGGNPLLVSNWEAGRRSPTDPDLAGSYVQHLAALAEVITTARSRVGETAEPR